MKNVQGREREKEGKSKERGGERKKILNFS